MMPDVPGQQPPRTRSVGAIVLTRGDRPEALRAALESLQAQRGVEVDVVVVGNGWEPERLPAGVRGVGLPENVGIPAGRNAGVAHVAGEHLFFLDDDARLQGPDALARTLDAFAADPQLGLVQMRVEPLNGGRRLREWVPRLGAGDPARSGQVTAVWEGAVAMPRGVFHAVGGWPAEFRSVHEGVDLAWRVMDSGRAVLYLAEAVVLHPEPPPASVPGRHGDWLYYGARNRVWLARRHLPLPLGVLFVASFVVRTAPGLRTREARAQAWRGYRDGVREPCGRRRRLHARTLWRMTRLRRPPIV